MEAVWGAVLSFLFVLATLYGYGAGTPHLEKEKSEQSEKKDEDKEKKDEDKKEENKKDEKSDESSSKDKSGKKGKGGQKDNGSSGKTSEKKVEYCVKDCPETWRMRP
jgi:flagellar biosynthesis/type III secretory pathway M-ring protein FliF/YscJ